MIPTPSDLEAGWQASARSPTGEVHLLVLRKGNARHEMPAWVELSPVGGVHGDRWANVENAATDGQVSFISLRVARLVASGDPDRLHLPGDNVVVDLDLDERALPVGSRLRVGTALVEITAKPHRGCAKFKARLGDAAFDWVNSPAHPGRRLRGVYARVLEAGLVALGQRVSPL